MRLDKFICKSTELTKEAAIRRIDGGEISVNGTIATDAATQIHANNTVTLNGERLKTRPFRYLLMHKPASTICSNIDEAYPSVFNYLDIEKLSELHIAGRLDADTTGLVLITDDGHWSFNITSPVKQCAKVYRVSLSKTIADDLVCKFKKGIKLQGEKQLTRPAILDVIGLKEAKLTITEGKFHQVKRMFASVGNRVIALHRERIGAIQLDLAVGQWRYLTAEEVNSITDL
jgi:16S rRNA pseudouridine516 synthase